MIQSETLDKFWPAYFRAHQKIDAVEKGKKNEFFGSMYADLAAVVEAVKPALLEAEIMFVQTIEEPASVESRPLLVTKLVHISGEFIGMHTPIISKDRSDPQKFGSALTYARRYALMTITGLAADDDDGNAGAAKQPKNRPQQRDNRNKPRNQGGRNQNTGRANQTNRDGAEALAKAKADLVAEVEHVRGSVESSMDTNGFLIAVSQDRLGRRPGTVEDVKTVRDAIFVGKYDLATGEKIPD